IMSAAHFASGGDLRLLLVEDDESYARMVGMMLERFASVRFQYDLTASLDSAVRELAAGPYPLVLLDLALPDGPGLRALTILVDRAPDVPIVILSGAENEALAIEAVKTGAQDYLIKSQASAEVLERSIRYAIERKHSEQQVRQLAFMDSLTQLPNRF